MTTTRHAPQDCPACGYRFDAASPADKDSRATPDEGDLSVCLNCGAAMTLDGGRWRSMTIEEIVDLPAAARAELFKAQKAIHLMHLAGLSDLRKGGHA